MIDKEADSWHSHGEKKMELKTTKTKPGPGPKLYATKWGLSGLGCQNYRKQLREKESSRLYVYSDME